MQYLSTQSQTAAPRKLKTEAQKDCSQKPTLTLSFFFPLPFHNIRSLCTRVRMPTHIHLNSSGSNAEQSLFCRATKRRKTEPGINWSTSAFSISKLNAISLLCRGKMKSCSQSNASHNSDIFYRTTRQVLMVTFCFEMLVQLLVCPCLKKKDGTVRRSTENTSDRFSYHQNISLIINLPCFDKNRIADTHKLRQCDAHFMLFTCTICHIFRFFLSKKKSIP